MDPGADIGFLIQAKTTSEFTTGGSIWGEWLSLDGIRYKPVGCRRNDTTADETIYMVNVLIYIFC